MTFELEDRTETDHPTPGPNRRSFLVGSAAVAATATSLFGLASQAQAKGNGKNTLQVGAGKAAISIPASLLPLDGFTTVHDPLYARVLLAENASRRIALVVLDLTSISEEAITDIRTAVTQASGVAAANVMVTVTHSFSAPHVMSSSTSTQEATWIQNITAAAAAAVTSAAANLQPARIGFGKGTADVNVNRNVLTNQGYWLGTNETLPSDKSVGVTRIDDVGGNPIAILVNYNVQSCVMQDSVMNSGDLPITADLAGATLDHVESQYDNGVVGFWLVGSCGDQFPAYRSKRYTIDKDKNWAYDTDAHDAGFLLLTVQGERLGTEVVRVSQTIETTAKNSTVRLITDEVTVNNFSGAHEQGPVTSYDFTPAGTSQAPAWIFQIGDGAFVGVSPELSTVTAEHIKQASPFPNTFVMSMFEGGAKNMADRWNYEHITYEATDSYYSEGDAEKLSRQILRDIRLLNK